ncbi:DUF6461 domain-containing protein [Streptomyces sp. NPDC047023]|uniref:DUF6461 domain-containing protein n=1 Tax=Streptomyces sp. NPDC047023 TaxID=3155139 RepID=UPI0033C44803
MRTVGDRTVRIEERMGFPLDEETPEEDLSAPAAFALAEHLTGIAVTPELLRDTTFACATLRLH